MLHLALGEISHSVYVFPTGSAVTVKVYNLTSDTWEVLDDDNAVEIMDGITGTGFYSWSLDNLHTAPAAETELLTFATDTITVQSSKVKYSGGYVEQIDQIKTQMDSLILSSGGVINIETPWVVGELRSGQAATIVLYDSTGASEALDDDTCSEIGVTGFYFWSTHNMTNYPAVPASFLWVMDDGVRRAYGVAVIGVPESVEDAVWDAKKAAHSDAGSFGESVPADIIQIGHDATAAGYLKLQYNGTGIVGDEFPARQDQATNIYHDTQRMDGLVEDDGGGNDRFTAKALEESPALDATEVEDAVWDAKKADHTDLNTFGESVPADIIQIAQDATAAGYLKLQYNGTGIVGDEFPARQDQVADVYTDTQRVDGLIEDDGGGNDRFTAKALEEAPSGSGATAQEVWEYVPTGAEPEDSTADLLTQAAGGTSAPIEALAVKTLSGPLSIELDLSDAFTQAGGTSWATRIVRVLDHDNNDVTAALLTNYTVASGVFTCYINRGGKLDAAPYELVAAVRISSAPSYWVSRSCPIYLEAR